MPPKRPMLERRKAALFKEAKELSMLCDDVEIGIVIFSPTERGPIVWPSVEDTKQRFLRFMNHRAAADSGAGANGDGSYYVPQPPAPQFGGPLWTVDSSVVPPPPPAPAAWFTPTLAAPPPPHSDRSLAMTAASSSSANNGGGTTHAGATASSSNNSGHNQLPCSNQVWPYNFSSSS